MKKTGIILTLLTLSIGFIGQSKDLNVSSSIEKVTLFTQGAQIHHKASKQINFGRQTLIFGDLPQNVNANSIQMGGKGSLTILSVTYRINHLSDPASSPKIKALEDSIQFLSESLNRLNNQIWIYNEEKDLLLKNKTIQVSSGGESTDELIKRANFFRKRMDDIFTSLTSIQNDQKKTNNQIQSIRRQISELRNGGPQKGEIVVEVEAKNSAKYDFEFSYTINNAGWYPIYDIRANSVSEPLKLTFNAKVYQRSGQDWNNIELTLSTSAPLSNINKPNFTPWRLKFLGKIEPVSYSRSNRKESFSSDKMESNTVVSEDVMRSMQAPMITAVNNQTSTTYEINTKYDVPSDGQHHSVSIAEYEIPATYTYYVAPKSSKQAFLLARATDWYKYNFIPGQANVFFENTFVGNTVINMNSGTDTLDISLGVDRGLIVRRERIEDFCKTRSLGNNKKESIGIGITLINNRKLEAEVEIVDQIPISSNNQITVELLESDKAQFEEKTGKLLWKKTLKPGKSEVLKFTYSVEYPKDQRLNL